MEILANRIVKHEKWMLIVGQVLYTWIFKLPWARFQLGLFYIWNSDSSHFTYQKRIDLLVFCNQLSSTFKDHIQAPLIFLHYFLSVHFPRPFTMTHMLVPIHSLYLPYSPISLPFFMLFTLCLQPLKSSPFKSIKL